MDQKGNVIFIFKYLNCHAKEDFNFFCTLQREELGLLGINYKASGFNLICLDFQRIRVPQNKLPDERNSGRDVQAKAKYE